MWKMQIIDVDHGFCRLLLTVWRIPLCDSLEETEDAYQKT